MRRTCGTLVPSFFKMSKRKLDQTVDSKGSDSEPDDILPHGMKVVFPPKQKRLKFNQVYVRETKKLNYSQMTQEDVDKQEALIFPEKHNSDSSDPEDILPAKAVVRHNDILVNPTDDSEIKDILPAKVGQQKLHVPPEENSDFDIEPIMPVGSIATFKGNRDLIICTIPGCPNKSHRAGICQKHSRKVCSFPNCLSKIYVSGKFCKNHLTEEEIRYKKSHPCASCNVNTVSGKFCPVCDPEEKNKKVEYCVVRFLRKQKITLFHNQIIDPSGGVHYLDLLVDRGYYRADILIDHKTHLHIIEVDENQHSQEIQDQEMKRMINIHRATQIKTYFTRFNPDNFKIDDVHQRLSFEDRLQILILNVANVANKIPEKDVTVEYLFYTMSNGRPVIENKIRTEEFKEFFKACYQFYNYNINQNQSQLDKTIN